LLSPATAYTPNRPVSWEEEGKEEEEEEEEAENNIVNDRHHSPIRDKCYFH